MTYRRGVKLYNDELCWVLEQMSSSEPKLVERLGIIITSACVNTCFCHRRTAIYVLADASRFNLINPALCALCNARELVRDYIRNGSINDAYFEEYTEIMNHPDYLEGV